MDLYNHTNPLFTKWVVRDGLLSTPFVVVDIGVQGGEHPRWEFLDPYVEIHGFDAIAEVVQELNRATAGARLRRYHNIALGDEDGDRLFFVSANGFNSSFYSADEFAEERIVPIRRLDTLYREGLLPRADYIKLDCEGFEPVILKGANQYLAESDLICVTTETNFDVSPVYPQGHFHAINEILCKHRLVVFDENHVRTPAADYAAAIAKRPWPDPNPAKDIPPLVVGRPRTYDMVFCPDLAADRRDPDRFGSGQASARLPPVDMVIKAMINFELHGLMDCAVELAVTFQDMLAQRLDVEKAIELLLAPTPSPRNTADVTRCLLMIDQLRPSYLERGPFIARIRDLEGELAVLRDAQAKQMAELQKTLDAERDASIVRIRELEGELAVLRDAQAKQMAELQKTLDAEREASITRFRELEGELATLGDAQAKQMAELQKTLDAEREASITRIRELEGELTTLPDAQPKQIAELQKTLDAPFLRLSRGVVCRLGKYFSRFISRTPDAGGRHGNC